MNNLFADDIARMDSIRWWHRIPVGIDASGATIYTPGEVNHGPNGGSWPTDRFGLPSDLTGKTVLDVGAWDGFFSFEAERRNAARVLAVDVDQSAGGNWGGTAGFEFAKNALQSQVEFEPINVLDLARDLNGQQFDVVLCYGVLYHVKDPLRAIEQLFAATVSGGICLIETARHPDSALAGYPVWSFQPGHHGDPTNYWYPSIGGLRAACQFAGFTGFRIVSDMGPRCCVEVRKAS